MSMYRLRRDNYNFDKQQNFHLRIKQKQVCWEKRRPAWFPKYVGSYILMEIVLLECDRQ